MRPVQSVVLLALIWISAGCGNSTSDGSTILNLGPVRTAGPVSAKREDRFVRRRTILLTSPALRHNVIPPEYVCGTKHNWLPLRWDHLPKQTNTILLYTGRVRKTRSSEASSITLTSAEVILGVSPERGGIGVGPFNAVSVWYRARSFCPRVRNGQLFVFQILALSAEQRLDPRTVTLSELLDVVPDALALGSFAARYGAVRRR